MKKYYSILLVLILPYISLAQIKIEERVEIDPVIISIPNNPGFNIDTTVCNKFEYETEILVTDGDDSTYSVWYGNCAEIGFGGYNDCIHFDINDGWIVTIEEGFEYVRPRTSYLDCDGPYGDQGNTFYVDYNYCFHLVFDKEEPATIAQVKIKFALGNKVARYTFDVYRPFFHISPKDSFQVMEYGDYIVVDNYEVLNQCDTYWPWLPDTVSIIKEIVQGNEYGQLWNSFTNEYGTSFTGSDIYLVANGIKPPQDAEIIVRLSTSDSDIDPINIVYIVKPVDLEITVVPPTIAAGDTASIIIQKKYLDGTVSDFDEWQTFEIAKIEGCALGEILVDGETGAYFSDVYQPIQFVADSLAESGTVKLKIGVLKYPSFASRPVVINNTPPVQTEQSQIITNDNNSESTITENQTNPPSDNPLLSCALEPVESVLNEDVGVVVGDEWCEDLDECDDPTEFPEIDWDDHRNGFELTVEKTGLTEYAEICVNQDGSMSLLSSMAFINSGYKEFMEYDEVEICLNPETNRLQFRYGDDNEITINWIWDYCDTYINALDIIRAWDIYSIPGNIKPYCYKIINSLEKQKEYPAKLTAGDYMFDDIWAMHEEQHRVLLEQSFNKFKPNYLEEMKNLEKSCEDFTSEVEAKNFYTEKARDLITKFYNAGLNDENQQSIRFDSKLIVDFEPWRELEDKVHKPVKKHIDDLIKLVKPSEIGCR